MPEQVLDGTQIVGVLVGQRRAGVAQRVIRQPGALQVEPCQMAIDDAAYAATNDPPPA